MSSRKRSISWYLLSYCSGVVLCAGCQATGGWAYNNSGKAYFQRGNYAMARDEFRQAALVDPGNPHYRHNLALAMKKTGDVQGAESVLRENLSRVSAVHQPTYHSLAQILVEQNRQGEAQELLTGWANTQPYVPEAQIELAWLQRQSGDIYGAEQSLHRALQTNPEHPTAMAHLGQLYQDAGQPDRAATMYQRSLAVNLEQPQVKSRLQMLVDGSARRTRNGMIMNPMATSSPMMVSAPSTMGPMMTQSPTVVSNPAMAAAPTIGPQPMSLPSGSMQTIDSSGIQFEAPIVAGPAMAPNADPAHTELAAELPLVEPY